MPASRQQAVTVKGLADLRRDLRRLGRTDLLKAVRVGLKGSAEIVVKEARGASYTPRRTGRLAASIRAGTSGNRAVIRSPLPYANPIHWGWPKRGIAPQPFLPRAAAIKAPVALEVLADHIDDAFRRNGHR